MKDKLMDETYAVGCLVEFNDIDYEQRDLLIELMSRDYSYLFKVLYNIIEDDALTLKLIDIFADKKIKFPSRKKVYKTLEKIKIYTYIKRHNYSETSINVLAKQYKKRPSQIRILISKIEESLNKSYKMEESNND